MMSIGQPLDRVDGRLKVTGAAKYAAEFAPANLAHAVLVQSTIAAGSIDGIDIDGAQRMPGVLAILTPDNAERLKQQKAAQQTITAPLLQNREVLFQGQHVAVAIAETFECATAAAAAIRVRYRPARPVTTMLTATEKPYVPKDFRNGEAPPDTEMGDAAAAFRGAAIQVDATYRTPVEHHNPMEPHATVAQWDGDRLTVWTATQGISGAHKTLAGLFGLAPEDVRVICPYLGGGFGSKGNTWPPVVLAAMAARKVGRPVKLVVTREQMFTSNGYRPMTVQRVRLAASADGALLSVRHDGITQMSMPSLGEFAEPVAMATRMLYASPNIATSHRLVAVNQGLPTFMRAPGEASGVFAIESAMDELAVALKMDPIDLRLRNYAEEDPTGHKPFASKALRQCYREGADAFGWARRTPEPRSMRDGRILVGMGMATSTYPTNRMPAKAWARVNADGTALVRCGTQDIGTGTYTVMTQVAADELGLAPGKVRFELGDSTYPEAPVSGGSMTVASVSPAVQAAARAAKGKILAMVSAVWPDVPLETLRLEGGAVIAGAQAITLADAFAKHGVDHVEADGEAAPGPDAKTHSMHAFGAQFAEVRVDPDLGTIRVSRWVGAFDCGRLLNAKTARSQLVGGIVFGIGMALLEETRVDAATGRIVNANIAEYLLPVNADVPDIRTIAIQSVDPVADPLGAKGIGELPMVGVAPAIANAVYHATGVRVRDLPIRIEDVLVG